MKKTAIIIVGTICSGKTTLCNKLHEDLNIDYINESNSNNLFGILNKLQNSRELIIIEHSDILNHLKEIKKEVKNIILIHLDVSDEILIKNYNQRIKNNAEGDFKNINMLDMKDEIKRLADNYKFENYLRVSINNELDYEKSYNSIKEFICKEIEIK